MCSSYGHQVSIFNGDLKEEVYVHQPLGFTIPGNKGKVLRLHKTLYDLCMMVRKSTS
jgi:hypothetical protein